MTEIQILGINRQAAGYIELSYKMTLTLPAIWGTGSTPIAGLEKIVAAYQDKFTVEVIPVTGTVVTVTETRSLSATIDLPTIKTQLQLRYTALRTQLDGLTLDSWDNAAGLSWDGATWTTTNNITDTTLISSETKATLALTATGAAAAGVTLTLPAVAGKFHNICRIEILAYSTAARTGSATPIVVTTTNLPGSIAFTFATAAAIGATDRELLESGLPIKSSVANTATTIVCPATTSVIWRVNAFYNLST